MELPIEELETHILKCPHFRGIKHKLKVSRCLHKLEVIWLSAWFYVMGTLYTHRATAPLAACTTGIVFNISGGKDLTLQEVNTVSEVVTSLADKDCNIIFGAMVDDKYEGGELQVTIIATGFSQNYEAELLAAPATNTRRSLVVPVSKVSLGPGSWR